MDVYGSVVVVGGRGMLGHAVVNVLASRKLPFISLDLPECDITRLPDVQTLFRQHKPTLLLNLAAYTKVDLCESQETLANAVNGHALEHLARMALTCGTKLVHISTDFVFDGRSDRPYRPDDAPQPLSAYGRSKLLGEQNIQRINPPEWLIVRTAWLYGRQGLNFPRTIVEKARAGQPLRVVNDQIGSPTCTCDLADAIFDLLDHNARGIFHVTNTGQTTWYDFARATLEEFKINADLAPVSTEDYLKLRPNQAIRPRYSVLDTQVFHQTTSHSLRPWRQALSDFRSAVNRDGF